MEPRRGGGLDSGPEWVCRLAEMVGSEGRGPTMVVERFWSEGTAWAEEARSLNLKAWRNGFEKCRACRRFHGVSNGEFEVMEPTSARSCAQGLRGSRA